MDIGPYFDICGLDLDCVYFGSSSSLSVAAKSNIKVITKSDPDSGSKTKTTSLGKKHTIYTQYTLGTPSHLSFCCVGTQIMDNTFLRPSVSILEGAMKDILWMSLALSNSGSSLCSNSFESLRSIFCCTPLYSAHNLDKKYLTMTENEKHPPPVKYLNISSHLVQR